MVPFIVRRVLWMAPTLFVVLLITFVIMHATPGGPWDTDPSTLAADPRVRETLDKQFGLDKPLFFNAEAFGNAAAAHANPLALAQAAFDGQFFNYLDNLAHLDLGPSYRFRGRQVKDLLFETPEGKPFWQSRVGTTFFLGILAMGIALAIGLPFGLITGLRQNHWLDHVGVLMAAVGYGIPSFVMGILLILIFAVWLGWVEVINFDYWEDWTAWVLPALALALPTAAYLARLTRASIIEVMNQDYVRTAHAKGLRARRVVGRHIVRNSLVPIVTFLGPALAALVTGSFIIETQFNVQGIGVLFVESIGRRDYTVILALTVFYAFIIALANLGVDLAYGFLDPRVRTEK